MYLIFDTETTGLPKNKRAPLTDFDNWPRVVQIAWQLHDSTGNLLSNENLIVKPDGFTIPYNAEKVHGISTERASKEGQPLGEVLDRFTNDLDKAQLVIGHNIIDFDVKVLGSEYLRCKKENTIASKDALDTQLASTEYCAIPEEGEASSSGPPCWNCTRSFLARDSAMRTMRLMMSLQMPGAILG